MKKASIIVLVVLLTLSVWGCSSKTPITANEFQAKMTAAGFEIIDAYDQLGGGDAEAALIAINDDYQIEFYVVPTEAQAITAFNQNKRNFEDAKGNSSSNTSVALANYGVYKLSTGGMYYVISRIDNTFIYIVTDAANKASVDENLKVLGY